MPEREGYTFAGWEYSGDGVWNNETNTFIFSGVDDFADTLTASWAKKGYLTSTDESVMINSDSGIISGLSVGLTSLDFIVPSAEDYSLEIEATSNGLGTGTVVNVINNNQIVESYVIVIYGDLDGNARTDGSDSLTAALIAGGLISGENVSEAVLMAADANHDGIVNELDARLLELAGLFLADISQTV